MAHKGNAPCLVTFAHRNFVFEGTPCHMSVVTSEGEPRTQCRDVSRWVINHAHRFVIARSIIHS